MHHPWLAPGKFHREPKTESKQSIEFRFPVWFLFFRTEFSWLIWFGSRLTNRTELIHIQSNTSPTGQKSKRIGPKETLAPTPPTPVRVQGQSNSPHWATCHCSCSHCLLAPAVAGCSPPASVFEALTLLHPWQGKHRRSLLMVPCNDGGAEGNIH